MVQSVKGTVASTNSKKRKANDYRQEAVESADIDEKAPSEPDARLTKQQKRDIRRAIIAADDQKVANKVPSASDSAEVRRMNKIMKRRARNVRPETIRPTPVPVNATSAPEARLTKQQKRDKRRAVIAAAGTVTTTSDYAADIKEINTSSVYRRVPILPPPSPFPLLNVDRFLVPGDKNFQKVLDTCYDGFVMDKPEEYSDEFHESFETSFTEIEKSGVFQFDLTQPAGLGTKVSAMKMMRKFHNL
jgi:FTO catalytic domain